jgi:hypothetical protein
MSFETKGTKLRKDFVSEGEFSLLTPSIVLSLTEQLSAARSVPGAFGQVAWHLMKRPPNYNAV